MHLESPHQFFHKLKRSKRRQYFLGIVACLTACICMTCPWALSRSRLPTPTPPASTSIVAPALPLPVDTATSTITPTETSLPTSTFTPTVTSTVSFIDPTETATPTLAVNLSKVEGAKCIPLHQVELATVTKIVDGDTIHVLLNGKDYKVRYIGIDTPEMSGDPYAKEAKTQNSKLVSGKQIKMFKDVSEVDDFDRLLRYVVVGNTFVNYQLVRKGFANASTYPPDVACSDTFAAAQNSAAGANLGLWGLVAIPPAAADQNCDPAYPTVCIPPPPPDLDCKDITFRRFQVLPPDPHHFDRDGDGVGCES